MINKIICFFVGSLILYSCATIVRPTGGEKDTTPPSLTMAKPSSESLNFSKSAFELKFDEFIVQEDFATKILVSPSIESLFSKYTGKGIKISWTDDLKPNTTYNFQFLNTIKDYNENNVLAGFQYTFSTGAELDTLAISGKVENSTFEEVENVRVCLISESEFTDSTFIKSAYEYATFAKKSGEFTFNYLPLGDFRLYAYSDKNNNDLWDEDEDFIAYYPEVISSTDSLYYHLELFKEDQESEFTSAKHSAYNQIELQYIKSIPEIETLELWIGNKPHTKQPTIKNEIVNVFFDESIEEDSLTIIINGLDTLPFYKTQYRNIKIDVVTDYVNIISNETAQLYVNYPLSSIDTSKIKTYIGFDSIVPTEIKLMEDFQTLTVSYANEIENLNIEFQDSSLVYSDSIFNSSKTLKVAKSKIEDLAIIQCSFKEHNFPLIVELFTKDNTLISSKYLLENENKVDFTRLATGEYKLRFIVDENRDKLFTSGSVHKKTQPEPIFNYTSPISLKPNWITEIVF